MDLTGSNLIILIVSILIALVLHEFMHAFVGHKLGDDTASVNGRLSLNPLSHIDPFMTIILPIMTIVIFGIPILAAKPVPFNPERVKFDEFGAAMIAAAGPLTNLALAVLTALAMGFLIPMGLGHAAEIFITLNVALFVFNLVPIPPLDGSRVLYSVAPDGVRDFMNRLEPFGFFLIFGLVLFGGFGSVLVNLNQMVLNLLP